MPSKLSRRSFCALLGGVGTASVIGGAGTAAYFTDQETSTGTIQAASQFPIRINCGGPQYTANDGREFEADSTNQYYSGGSTYSTSDGISNTNDDTLYQTERWGDPIGYDIPVANGTYDVRIHLAEIYFGPSGAGGGGTGDRVFDLSVEGSLLLDDYDLYADVGHDTAVVHVAQDITVTDGTLNISATASQNNAKIGAIEVIQASGSPQPTYQQVDTTPSQNATFDVNNLVIEAAGADIWTGDDEYGAIYEDDVSGDFTATVTVDSQEAVHSWSKAGIMVANDITNAGGSIGDVMMAVTPDNGFQSMFDTDADGFIDQSPDDGSTSVYPCDLRIEKSGTTFTCSYSTDGGSTWTQVASQTVSQANATQDVGLAVTSHDTSQTSQVDFSNFQVS